MRAWHAFSWTQAGGMVDLGTLPGFPYSKAVAVSNGQVVGWSDDGTVDVHATRYGHAVLWTEVGDCDGSGVVQINEIIQCVNIALGNADVSTCTAGDQNGDGAIEINEIIMAVNNALNGCP